MAEDFLRRWSRRKHAQAAKVEEKPAPAPENAKADEAVAPPPLPPVETLTPESDFTGFMQPKVDDALRRAALKKLFRDPHFNIPDPYEAYSGDWTGGVVATPTGLLDKALDQARTALEGGEEKKPAAPAEEAKEEPRIAEGEKKDDGARRQDA
jgi:hypothetical protein